MKVLSLFDGISCGMVALQLAGGNSSSEKAENDFYATDPKTVDLFNV